MNADVDRESEDLDRESEELDRESEDLDRESEELDRESEDLDRESEDLDHEGGQNHRTPGESAPLELRKLRQYFVFPETQTLSTRICDHATS